MKKKPISIDALRSAITEFRHHSQPGMLQATTAIFEQLEEECPEFIDVMLHQLATAINEASAVMGPLNYEALGTLARQQVAIAIWLGRRAAEIEAESNPSSPAATKKKNQK